MAIREFVESREEMEEILMRETVGYLGLSRDGQPYVVPLNYAYVEGRILFHCAPSGQKLDYLRANPRVCLSVGRQSGGVQRHAGGNPCHVDSESVLCFGTARVLDDAGQRQPALNAFNRCFRPDAAEISAEEAAGCAVVEIEIEEMTGRRERQEDRQRTYWRYAFPRHRSDTEAETKPGF
jgi:nitroimidazol reductase NimA-like FMN-containing flavoprotein (pyridoxamine 5'-phosphate oxidase superfamily)